MQVRTPLSPISLLQGAMVSATELLKLKKSRAELNKALRAKKKSEEVEVASTAGANAPSTKAMAKTSRTKNSQPSKVWWLFAVLYRMKESVAPPIDTVSECLSTRQPVTSWNCLLMLMYSLQDLTTKYCQSTTLFIPQAKTGVKATKKRGRQLLDFSSDEDQEENQAEPSDAETCCAVASTSAHATVEVVGGKRQRKAKAIFSM
jgi:hypothetical protein